MTETDEMVVGGDREVPLWRWLAGGLLVLGLGALVAFGIYQSRNDGEGAGPHESRPDGGPAPVAGREDVNYMLFCAAAQPGPNGLDVNGALDQISPPSFPTKTSFTVVVSVTADRPGRRYEIARFDADGKVDFAQELNLSGGTLYASVNAVPIKDLELAGPGEVVFRVLRDGQTVAERALRVVPRGAPVRTNQPVTN